MLFQISRDGEAGYRRVAFFEPWATLEESFEGQLAVLVACSGSTRRLVWEDGGKSKFE